MTTPGRIALARSLLFVPGNRPQRFEKAVRSGADAVVLDLEDSVPDADKAGARGHVEQEWAALAAQNVPLLVRINAADEHTVRDDLALLGRLRGVAAVMVPKAESRAALLRIRDAAGGAALLPLVESAAGLHALHEVAATPGVVRLAVGAIDFMADTGIVCDEAETELVPLRFAVALATRAAGLAPAVDGVTVQADDTQRVRADTLRALRFGFGGKLCIHPAQVAAVHRAMQPSDAELAWARRVLAADAAAQGAAVQVDGRMVDLPVVLQARRTLARGAPEAGADGP